ncbi:hypothetical protein [Streptomyces lavendulocolor]|uniref:hypothetical protein n=1 Tax=Streptomyces lavendulocolor TaxID=67316 RepID=UPI003C2D157E
MSAPTTHDPQRVTTRDGATWIRRAVDAQGRGLYALEGVCDCPEYVMATLAELAEHGIKGQPLAAAVAELGALPLPVAGTEVQRSARMAAITSRTDAASAGPWFVEAHQPTLTRRVVSSNHMLDANLGYLGNCNQADAEFIAHTREDVPWLLTEVDGLRARVAELDGLLAQVRDLLPRDRCITEGLPNDADAARAEYGAWELVAEVLGVPLPYVPPEPPIAYALTEKADEDVSPQVRKLRGLLARQRADAAPLEDPHDSPLHHDYRTPRDMPSPGEAAQVAAEMLADRYPTKGAS